MWMLRVVMMTIDNDSLTSEWGAESWQSWRALILYRRRRFINHLLTYLLTYLQDWWGWQHESGNTSIAQSILTLLTRLTPTTMTPTRGTCSCDTTPPSDSHNYYTLHTRHQANASSIIVSTWQILTLLIRTSFFSVYLQCDRLHA